MPAPAPKRWLRSLVSRREWWALLTVVAFVGWAMVADLLNGRPLRVESPFLYAPLLAAGGVAIGRWAGTRLNSAMTVVVLLLLTTASLVAVVTTGGPLAAPLGYSNANAALAAQLLALCGLHAVGSQGAIRLLSVLAGIAALATSVASWSQAGLVASVALTVVIGIALTGRVRRRWWPPALGAFTLAGSAAAVVNLAAREQWPAIATAGLSSARHELWADALALWQQRPVVGSGAGAFREFSRLAADPDTPAAHSSILQVAAETGLIGVALFGVLIACGFGLAVRGEPGQALIACAALTVLGAHSCVDYVLQFPVLVLAAGLVVGSAGSVRRAHVRRARRRPG